MRRCKGSRRADRGRLRVPRTHLCTVRAPRPVTCAAVCVHCACFTGQQHEGASSGSRGRRSVAVLLTSFAVLVYVGVNQGHSSLMGAVAVLSHYKPFTMEKVSYGQGTVVLSKKMRHHFGKKIAHLYTYTYIYIYIYMYIYTRSWGASSPYPGAIGPGVQRDLYVCVCVRGVKADLSVGLFFYLVSSIFYIRVDMKDVLMFRVARGG